MARLALAVLLGFSACETPPVDSAATHAADESAPALVRDTVLETALAGVASQLDGVVGVAVAHLQQGVHASLNGERPFVLASVYKLAIAYAALQRTDAAGADAVTIMASDVAPGPTPLAAGTHATVARLVQRSLAHSDNTASDALLRIAGGADEVNRRVRALGAAELRVDRSMRQVFAAWREAPAAFVEDARDSGTAASVVVLLAALHRGDGLRAEMRQLLLDALHSADTGPNRIRAGVPAGTPVAHKTGTLGPFTHDAGIITLPGGRGDVVVVVLVQSDAPLAARERLIATVSRLVWERFAV